MTIFIIFNKLIMNLASYAQITMRATVQTASSFMVILFLVSVGYRLYGAPDSRRQLLPGEHHEQRSSQRPY